MFEKIKKFARRVATKALSYAKAFFKGVMGGWNNLDARLMSVFSSKEKRAVRTAALNTHMNSVSSTFAGVCGVVVGSALYGYAVFNLLSTVITVIA